MVLLGMVCGRDEQARSLRGKCRAEGQHSQVPRLALWVLDLKRGTGSLVLVTPSSGSVVEYGLQWLEKRMQ